MSGVAFTRIRRTAVTVAQLAGGGIILFQAAAYNPLRFYYAVMLLTCGQVFRLLFRSDDSVP